LPDLQRRKPALANTCSGVHPHFGDHPVWDWGIRTPASREHERPMAAKLRAIAPHFLPMTAESFGQTNERIG
jgi:hypothetical protein